MGAKAEVVSGLPDALKWALSTVVLVAGLGAFYYYADESLLYRVVGQLRGRAMTHPRSNRTHLIPQQELRYSAPILVHRAIRSRLLL